jgi:iron complex outermembrane receptor protein
MVSTSPPVSAFPSVGLTYHIAASLSLSASVSRGYTAMSISNLLNSDGTIQEDITPETGWSREVSAHITRNVLTARITAYHMDIRNTIVTRRIIDDTFEKYNGGHTRHRGFEAEIDMQLPEQMWDWRAGYTFSDHVFAEFHDGGVDYRGNTLPGIPKHRLFQQLSFFPIAQFRLTLHHHWVSTLYLNDANTYKPRGHHLIGGAMDYTLQTGDAWKWHVSINVHNLFNTPYASMFQINAPGEMPRYYYPGKPLSAYLRIAVEYRMGKENQNVKG